MRVLRNPIRPLVEEALAVIGELRDVVVLKFHAADSMDILVFYAKHEISAGIFKEEEYPS